ncbi:ribokinase-like [Teleopsis dalmanni]|uniref:ribokinase-like n=1 Tax=Teleopsis dalmanni TaxID=139649 RepID=UPI000D32B842|nr:ribokinase-like [Teleopsis dalmanni]XP_037934175.1 ribokinase-like [Teleopsis dalmanni]
MAEDIEIIVYGAAYFNIISRVPRLPRKGEKMVANEIKADFGGDTIFSGTVANKLGARTAVVTKVGLDDNGKSFAEYMQSLDIDTTYLEICRGQRTGIRQINIGDNGQKHIISIPGANILATCVDIGSALEVFKNAKVLICQQDLNLGSVIHALKTFKGISILDGVFIQNPPLDCIKEATYYCCSGEMAARILGVSKLLVVNDFVMALNKILEMGAKIPIITVGLRGVVYVETQETRSYILVPLRPRSIRNLTNTGTGFVGALAYYLAHFPNVSLQQKIGCAYEVTMFSGVVDENCGSDACELQIDPLKVVYPWRLLRSQY